MMGLLPIGSEFCLPPHLIYLTDVDYAESEKYMAVKHIKRVQRIATKTTHLGVVPAFDYRSLYCGHKTLLLT